MFNAFITSLSVFVSSVSFQSENWDRFPSIMPWASVVALTRLERSLPKSAYPDKLPT